jgi:membrane AbrB-like protein
MPPASDRITRALHGTLTLAIGGAGGFVAHLLGLPAAWMMGAAVAVAAAGVFGLPMVIPPLLNIVTLIAAGLMMGASVSRDSFALIAQWPLTMLAMTIELVVIVVATGWLLRRLFGLDRGTAYLSSFPGQMSMVMSIAAGGVGDPRQIAVIQATRVLVLVSCVPLGALLLPLGHVTATPAGAATEIGPLALVGVAVACGLTGYLFNRLRLPAGWALGAMAAALAAKFGGLFDGAMPPVPFAITLVALGSLIGSRFSGMTLRELRLTAAGGLFGTAFTIAVTSAIALAVWPLVDMPLGQIWIAFAPGALEGMGALGVALGYDAAFIAAHHVARLILLIIAMPTVAALVRRADVTKPDVGGG